MAAKGPPGRVMRPNRADDAPADGETVTAPERMCVICRRRFPKAGLARYVADASGMTFDEEKTMPGRGWYVCSDTECRKRFAKFRPGVRRKKGVLCHRKK